jgi:ribulose-phosphate 3-epimerase
LQAIADVGMQPSVTLNPATPLLMIEEVIPLVCQVLLMSVNPGFGGQSFIPATLDRIRHLRDWLNARNPTCLLEVDGGVTADNLGQIVAAGADTIVVGSSIFNPSQTVPAAIAALRASYD